MRATIASQVFLSTAIVNVHDKFGRKVKCRVLLDSGSQTNIMTEDLADKLNIKTKFVNVPVRGINNRLKSINEIIINNFEWELILNTPCRLSN